MKVSREHIEKIVKEEIENALREGVSTCARNLVVGKDYKLKSNSMRGGKFIVTIHSEKLGKDFVGKARSLSGAKGRAIRSLCIALIGA